MAKLKLATLIQNPGEPTVETRYHDPAVLAGLGYNGLVLYETTALSGVESPEVIKSAELRRWVQQQTDEVGRNIERAQAAGLAVYLCYDALVLARDVVTPRAPALTCKSRPGTLCPASEQAVEMSAAALGALLGRFPGVAGVVLRFGDTDAERLPHLMGNDIYLPHCPRCSQFGRADRIVALLERFYDLVVDRHGKKLIARAWNVRPSGLHDAPELARRVADRLPGAPDDENLVLSFKFTQTDFWRYQRWNPCSLVFGRRPVLYELQCQREFEGKGGVPNWQAGLWRDGCPEARAEGEPAGLAEVSASVNVAGLWAWVRGGGWGGPFVADETWIDANVFAAPRLADDPRADPEPIAEAWLRERLGIDDDAAMAVLKRVLAHSPEQVRQAFYIGPVARGKADPWHPSADYIQDDLLDAAAAWRIVQRLPESQLDAVVAEKRAAAEQIAQDRVALQKLVGDRAHRRLEPLVNTLVYAESLYETLRDLFAGLVAYRRLSKGGGEASAGIARQKLLAAQTAWNHHTQRHGSMPGAATAFRETQFWEITQDMLAKLS